MIVYVRLLNEGTDAWAPVSAKQLKDGSFLLIGPDEDQMNDVEFEFLGGSRVKVEQWILSGEMCLTVVELL